MIFERTLRRMFGEATINETRGYLFEERDGIKFAYMLPEGRIAIDPITFADRIWMLRWFEGRIIGYDLSGKPAEKDYAYLEPILPKLPVIRRVPTSEDFKNHDKRVVLYGRRLAIIQGRELVYRDIDSDLDERGMPEGVEPCIGLIRIHGNPNGSVCFTEQKFRDQYPHSYPHAEANIMLRRNGI